MHSFIFLRYAGALKIRYCYRDYTRCLFKEYTVKSNTIRHPDWKCMLKLNLDNRLSSEHRLAQPAVVKSFKKLLKSTYVNEMKVIYKQTNPTQQQYKERFCNHRKSVKRVKKKPTSAIEPTMICETADKSRKRGQVEISFIRTYNAQKPLPRAACKQRDKTLSKFSISC